MSEPHDMTDEADKTVILPVSPSPSSSLNSASVDSSTSSGLKASRVSSPSSANILPAGTRLGEFEILGLVGEGGFGIVYLAFDHSLQREVALKEYMPSALAARTGSITVSVKSDRHLETFTAGLKSFINEARLLAQFDHPSLIKVYRFWEDNGTAYMVMPYYEGHTLKQALHVLDEPPSELWLKQLFTPLLDAIAKLHRERCYHRDIAPDNILILPNQTPLLLDFGAARRVISDMTQALTVILKPGYAPIEQYAEMPNMKQGAWTDIYALGAVMYYAILGKAPVASVARLLSDPLEPVSVAAIGQYSDSFLKAIDQALAVKPEERPQTIEHFQALLGLTPQKTYFSPYSLPEAEKNDEVPAILDEEPIQETEDKTVILPATHSKMQNTSISNLSSSSEVAQNSVAPSKVGAPKKGIVSWLIAGGMALLVGWFGYGVFTKDKTNPPVSSAHSVISTTPSTSSTANSSSPLDSATQPAIGGGIAKKQPFRPVAMLDDIVKGSDPAFKVRALPEKEIVVIHQDELKFQVHSSEKGYVYVLAVGTENDFMLLFPNHTDQQNTIAANTTITLPNAKWPMKAHGPAGTDRFVVIISEAPRDFKPLLPVNEGDFMRFPIESSTQLYQDYTGTLPLFAGEVRCSSQPCSTRYGAAQFSIQEKER